MVKKQNSMGKQNEMSLSLPPSMSSVGLSWRACEGKNVSDILLAKVREEIASLGMKIQIFCSTQGKLSPFSCPHCCTINRHEHGWDLLTQP